jgi:hypothetical protein
MSKSKKNNSGRRPFREVQLASRDNQHYFYGILGLLVVTILFRPQYVQTLLTASGGFGLAEMVRKIRA